LAVAMLYMQDRPSRQPEEKGGLARGGLKAMPIATTLTSTESDAQEFVSLFKVLTIPCMTRKLQSLPRRLRLPNYQ